MRTYTRPDSVLPLRRLRSVIQTTRDEIKAESDSKKVALRASDRLTHIASWLTLDDFGGRSDALGG